MRPKIIHEILADLISRTSFTIDFKEAVDNTDGTFTLTGICGFHHAQPGAPITINSNPYVIVDYNSDMGTMIVKGTDAINVTSFILYDVFFCHGTPLQTENENSKIAVNVKTPMIYLLEPYETEYDESVMSLISYRSDVTLCFLTQADIQNWTTDETYHKAIMPMKRLMEDFIQIIKDNGALFYTDKLKVNPKFHTKFGINIKGLGTTKLYFSENFAGVSVRLKFEVFDIDECDCVLHRYLQEDPGRYIEVD